MKLRWMFCILAAGLIVIGPVLASDFEEMQLRLANRHESLDDCEPDFVVGALPYTNSTTLDGQIDCDIRPTGSHIYEVRLPGSGYYTFSTCREDTEFDTWLILMSECCGGIEIISNDDACNDGQPGGSIIDCYPLEQGVYYLHVFAETAGIEADYEILIEECPRPCGGEALDDGVYEEGGTFKYVQTTDQFDEPPYYEGPWFLFNVCIGAENSYGFGTYNYHNQDFGWKHIFPDSLLNNPEGYCLESVRVIICAFDVDDDCDFADDPCERDYVTVDGQNLGPDGAPAYLTGMSGVYAVSTFNIPPELLTDDGILDVQLDIDALSDTCHWATTVSWSMLEVTWTDITNCNDPPYTPEAKDPPCIDETTEMCVIINGPFDPPGPDPDGDNVTYDYTWYKRDCVDGLWTVAPGIGNESCVDAADSHPDEQWKCIVYAIDVWGQWSEDSLEVVFPCIVDDCSNPRIGWDYGDLDPECYTVAVRDDGPAHAVRQNRIAWLGDDVSVDESPKTVDLDEFDDGVVFLNAPWEPCDWVCVEVTITAGPGYNGEDLYLYGWKDGNLDCDFLDTLCEIPGTPGARECLISGHQYNLAPNRPPGVQLTDTLCFFDPGIDTTDAYDGIFRFRLMSEFIDCDSAWFGTDELLGEVEDYIKTDLQLAVELIDFNALMDGNDVRLEWSTASESQNSYFEVQRAEGDGVFHTIAELEGAGTTAATSRYSYVDPNVTAGIAYGYRLLAVDINGLRREVGLTHINASPDAPAVIHAWALYANYPNPFNPTTTITYDMLDAAEVQLQVYDLLGRNVATLVSGYQSAGRHQVEFHAGELASGVYFYRIDAGDFSAIRKMVLMK